MKRRGTRMWDRTGRLALLLLCASALVRGPAAGSAEPAGAAGADAAPLKILYFTTPGCRQCAKVDRLLESAKSLHPDLLVETRNIRDPRSMRMNEALCQRLGVPERLRLVTPALFTGAGCLIKKDITEPRLEEMLARVAWECPEGWDTVPEGALAAAEEAIRARYRALGLWVVAAAGFLDGINPCAFATIVFFLSYLHVARRKPREILWVGAAFVLGVFLAYFALGLGLVRVLDLVSRHPAVRGAARAVNWTIAGFALVVAVLNARDGVLCLRGRLKDMSLQLPGFLKDRIHATVRIGARQRRFVAAAFGAGVAISVLELACTGQVYAPTILFMLRTGRGTAGATGLLGAYNAAFVAPLVAVFLLAYFGLRSEALGRVLGRHAAGVKFATALLFLGLFLFFVLADRIPGLEWR